jgi:RNA polymerase sigma factor (sigma-70 family)
MTEYDRSELSFIDDPDGGTRERGWTGFVEQFTRLLLRTARDFGGDYDACMDRYRFILESLREDDFRRLRAYRSITSSAFAAWLAVVARRLCLDFERQRLGRVRGNANHLPSDHAAARRLRHALTVLGAADYDPGDRLPAAGPTPEESLRELQLRAALDAALHRLDPKQQLLLRLRYEDGLSVQEISKLLDVRSVFHAYRQLKTALAQARLHLEASGVRDADP